MMIYTLLRWHNKNTSIEVISSYFRKDLEAIKELIESTTVYGKVDRYSIEEVDIPNLTTNDVIKAKESRKDELTSGVNCFDKCSAIDLLESIIERHCKIVDKIFATLENTNPKLSVNEKLSIVEHKLKLIKGDY